MRSIGHLRPAPLAARPTRSRSRVTFGNSSSKRRRNPEQAIQSTNPLDNDPDQVSIISTASSPSTTTQQQDLLEHIDHHPRSPSDRGAVRQPRASTFDATSRPDRARPPQPWLKSSPPSPRSLWTRRQLPRWKTSKLVSPRSASTTSPMTGQRKTSGRAGGA